MQHAAQHFSGYQMDLKQEHTDNKELVVIRSSSCVIKICETSSVVFKSCHSDTSASLSQETRIFRTPEPLEDVEENRQSILGSKRRKCYSEEDAVVERSLAHNSDRNDMGCPRENENPSQLPNNVLQLIAPSVSEAVHAHSSHYMNEYDMLNILIQVLDQLKADCRNIFEKRESSDARDENAVKLIIRECFTDIMVRYSTEPSSSPKGNSYNRCQKIISRSIKSLTLECVDIIERAICKQAKVMQNNRVERETSKSLLIKLMQTIQAELNQSKQVLKVVNTELHHPSFQFIFELLKYFIEKSAIGFKRSCQKSNKPFSSRSRRLKGAGEESDHSCEISISAGDIVKLDEYASRLDRLLEKVTREPLLEEPKLVIDCYHCTTKCKDQDLLLKTVTRFTEEIKQELINHARVVHESSNYSYLAKSQAKNSREISRCGPDTSTLQARAGGIQGDVRSDRSASLSPSSSPVRNVFQQPRPSAQPHDSIPRKQPAPGHQHSTSCDSQQKYKGSSIAYNNLKNGISHQEPRFFSQHATEQGIAKNNVKTCTKLEPNQNTNFRLASPSCLPQHKIGYSSNVSKNIDCVPRGQKYSISTNMDGGSRTKTEPDKNCRYCTSHAANNNTCSYDAVKLEEATKRHISHVCSTQIHRTGASCDRLPKSPIVEKRITATAEHNRGKDRKIVPKEEQGLVKKGKPDDQAKLNDKSNHNDNPKQDEKPKQDDKPVQDIKPSNENHKKAQLKNGDRSKNKSPEANASLKSSTSKKEEKGENKSNEKEKLEKGKDSTLILNKDDNSAKLKTSEPINNEKKPNEIQTNQKQGKIDHPIHVTEKDPKRVPEHVEQKQVDGPLQGAGILKAAEENSKTKDPAHCCRMNCNCRNRRGETQARRDSMNQTDQEPCSQSQNKSCCKGFNCGRNSIPIFTNGCMCKIGGVNDGEVRPIYQFFANTVPLPCTCKETEQQKEAHTSNPATPLSSRRDSYEASTQTSKNQLNKSRSEYSSSALSSSAPSKSAPSTPAPSSYGTSTGPSGFAASSSSDPTYIKSSTTQPTSSTPLRTGKSDSMVSCTCSMDKQPSQSADTPPTKTNMKDACTSDTNCCCPEKIEEVFQEFDDKYSEVVKEIKFLIREGYIPLNQQQTRELTVTASRISPTGTSSKTATCRCSPDSCKRCRGNPAAAFSRDHTYSNKVHSGYEIDNKREGGFQSAGKKNYPKVQVKDESGTYDECETPPTPPLNASRDTFIYNELQKDIHDLKELVKNTRFGNCPCCQCCKCEPEKHINPCSTNADGPSNISTQDGAKKTSKPVPGAAADKDTERQKNVPSVQPDNNIEPSAGQFKSNGPSNDTEAPGEATYFGTAPANVLKRMMSPTGEEEPVKSPSPKNEPIKKRDSVKVENQLEQSMPSNAIGVDGENIQRKQSISPETIGRAKESEHENENERKGGKRLSDGVQQYIAEGGRGLDPAPKEPTGSEVPRSSDASQTKGSISKDPLGSSEDKVQSAAIGKESSTPASEEPTPVSTLTEIKSGRNTTKQDSPAPGKRSSATNTVVSSASAAIQASSSILKEGTKDKLESKTTPKKVEIDEPPTKPSAGTSDHLSEVRAGVSAENDFGAMRQPPQMGSEQLPQKTVSNVSFGSKKSARSNTSSKNLVLSPEQEALFQSRERLREYTSHGIIPAVDDDYSTGRGTTDRQYAAEPDTPSGPTKEDQPGFFQRMFGGNTKTTTKSTEEPVSISDDSVAGDSSGDSTANICRALLGMDMMPCRFWSDDATPVSRSLDTYVMVLERESSNDLSTRDETFIISDKKRTRAINKIQNENTVKKKLKKGKGLDKPLKSNLAQQTAIFASKGTSTIWKGLLTSPIDVIKELCNLPTSVTPKSTGILERESPRSISLKPSKKLGPRLNVSSRYSRVSYNMPKNRDRKLQNGGDIRAYSSESFNRNRARPHKTEDKEVQVTKWNVMTQTAGPRKFNRTDISNEIEDKLARYLGLERMVEDTSVTAVSENSKKLQSVKNRSTCRSNTPHNCKKYTRSIK